MITVRTINKDTVRKRRSYYADRLEAAYLRNHLGHSSADALDIIICGDGDLIEITDSEGDSELVMALEQLDGTAFITAIAGSGFHKAAPVLDAFLDSYARRNGLQRIALCGRQGWANWLKQFGYSGNLVILTKEL